MQDLTEITQVLKDIAATKRRSQEVKREKENAVIEGVKEVLPQVDPLSNEGANFLWTLGNVLHRFELSEDEKKIFHDVFLNWLEKVLFVLYKRQPIYGIDPANLDEETLEKHEEYFSKLSEGEIEKEQNEYFWSLNVADSLITGLGQMKETKVFQLLGEYPRVIRCLNDHGITVAIRECLSQLPREKHEKLLRIAVDYLDDKKVAVDYLDDETIQERVCFVSSGLLYHSEVFLSEIVKIFENKNNNDKER